MSSILEILRELDEEKNNTYIALERISVAGLLSWRIIRTTKGGQKSARRIKAQHLMLYAEATKTPKLSFFSLAILFSLAREMNHILEHPRLSVVKISEGTAYWAGLKLRNATKAKAGGLARISGNVVTNLYEETSYNVELEEYKEQVGKRMVTWLRQLSLKVS